MAVEAAAGRPSWVFGTAAGPAGWAGVEALAPDAFAAFDRIEAELDRLVPAEIVELCRARLAFLLGAPAPVPGDPTGKLAHLAEWPSSPLFDARDRACLAVTEQWAIDVAAMEPAQIDALLDHFTVQEAYAFLSALWFTEGTLRLGLVLGVDRPAASASREED